MDAPITAVYAALSAGWLVALAFNVAWRRRATQIGLGTGGDPGLTLAVRAHGNAAETLPLALLLLLLLELNGAPGALLHVVGVVLLAARLAHAEGVLLHGAGSSPGRFYGTIATWATLLVMAGSLVWLVLT